MNHDPSEKLLQIDKRHSFLLRVWYEEDRGCWLYCLNDVSADHQWLFADPAQMAAFFTQQSETA